MSADVTVLRDPSPADLDAQESFYRRLDAARAHYWPCASCSAVAISSRSEPPVHFRARLIAARWVFVIAPEGRVGPAYCPRHDPRPRSAAPCT